MTLLERDGELAAVETLVQRGSGILIVEGRAGIGKTSLVEVACQRARELDREILRARGSELEADFAFGVVRQLFERRLASATADEREMLLVGPAAAAQPLLCGRLLEASPDDTVFAVVHGLYWLAANLSTIKPLLLAVDDAHCADDSSLRWLTYLGARLDGLALAMIVTLRPGKATSMGRSLLSLRAQATTVVRPALLSEDAVRVMVRAATGDAASDELCVALRAASGGNPLYVTELLRAITLRDRPWAALDLSRLLSSGWEGIARQVIGRASGLDPRALQLAQTLAVLGDGCMLRHAAMIAGVEMRDVVRLAAGLVRCEILETDDPPRFIHPVVRDALEASLGTDERHAAHRSAAMLLHADGAPAGQVAAHLIGVPPAGDDWVLARLREAARMEMTTGAPRAAAALLDRALVEPPPSEERISVLREAAQAEAGAGRASALVRLKQALELAADPRERAEIALEIAEAYAALFRWVDAVDVIEVARAELGACDEAFASRLEAELVICGLHDARCASRVGSVLERMSPRLVTGKSAEALAVARGMAMILAGRPADEAAGLLEEVLARAEVRVQNWDTRAALLWSLVVAERFEAVETALAPMIAEVSRSGSARGFVATYSTLGLLKLRLGALPEADSAARLALSVLQERDFAPGLPFAATVLADVAVEAGELDDAEALLALLPQEGWPGVATVLIPAARGRLRLAQGRPVEALAEFQRCAAMFDPDVWGMEMRDVGYLHARAGAAQALLRLGDRARARDMAQSELADVKVFGTSRALGIALRVVGLAEGGTQGIKWLVESVAVLRNSPALLELAHSLVELGAALRRSGARASAREPLAEGLDLAARCGARPLCAHAREELRATGARPRREWRTGLEALTPGELRVVRLAAEGATNRQIAHELYVTLKTVEGHLSRAYAKLGITNRGQLPGLLEGEATRARGRKYQGAHPLAKRSSSVRS